MSHNESSQSFQIDGSHRIDMPREELWFHLNDPDILRQRGLLETRDFRQLRQAKEFLLRLRNALSFGNVSFAFNGKSVKSNNRNRLKLKFIRFTYFESISDPSVSTLCRLPDPTEPTFLRVSSLQP